MSTKYTEDHEWIRTDGDTATVGITNYAQEQLGEVVFVELPEVDKELSAGDEAAVIESVKAAGEVKCPAGGTVLEVNTALDEDPAKVNEDPTGEGWFFKIKLSDSSQTDTLMNESAYNDYVASLD